MEIRYTADLKTLQDLDAQCFENVWTVAQFEHLLHQTSTDQVWVLEDGGLTVGYLVFRVIDPDVELHRVGILPAFRHQGWATWLLRRWLKDCSDKGYEFIFLEVHVNNLTALHIYTQLGFELVGKRKNYYCQPPGDACILQFNLKDSLQD